MNQDKLLVRYGDYAALVEENRRLREALEIYADEANWFWGTTSDCGSFDAPDFVYCGGSFDPTKPARDALCPPEEGK